MTRTCCTSSASRHSRNTPWPTMPVAPNNKTFMDDLSVGWKCWQLDRSTVVGGATDLQPTLPRLGTGGLGLPAVLQGIVADQQVQRQLLVIGQLEQDLRNPIRIARLIAGVGTKQFLDRTDARQVVVDDRGCALAC